MYAVGLIDISQWNKAGWKGTVYGWSPPGVDEPPFLGLLFSNSDAGKEIFERWKKHLGDCDINELIQVSIIEGEIEGEPRGYSVYVGPNPNIAKSSSKTKDQNNEKYFMLTARIHRMTPEPNFRNLEKFKSQYFKYGRYLFLPVCEEVGEPRPVFDLSIMKKSIKFVKVSELTDRDPEIVVLKKEGWSGRDAKAIKAVTKEAPSITPEKLTEMISILEGELATGGVVKPIDPMILDSLASVKYDSEGLVILETVNPLLMVVSEEVAQEVYEREAGKVPLHVVQKSYVDFLNQYFGDAYSHMVGENLTPHEMAEAMSRDPDYVESWKRIVPEMLDSLREGWYRSGAVTTAHLRKMSTLKAVYGGNVFPHPSSNLVSNAGLYVDTLVLPDPILSCLSTHKILKPDEFVKLLVRHALTASAYSRIALAELEIPIVVFTPSYFFLSQQLPQLVLRLSEEDLCVHLQKVFNYSFSSAEDVKNYFSAARTMEALAASVVDKDRFLFDIEESPLPLDQLEVITEELDKFEKTNLLADPMLRVLVHFYGRFMQVNSAIAHCDLYEGIPLIDAPTSWQYYLWKLEYGSAQASDDAAIAHVLHADLREMPLITNVSVDGIIELRKRGLLTELRGILREGIEKIEQASQDSVSEIGRHVAENIRAALKEYEKLVKEIPRQIASSALKAVSIGGAVSLGIAAAASGSPPLTYLAIAAGYLGLPTVRDVIQTSRDIYSKYKSVRNSPVGIFFKIRN